MEEQAGIMYLRDIYPSDFYEEFIFPPGNGNADNYNTIQIPGPNDIINLNSTNKNQWYLWFQVLIFENYNIEIRDGNNIIRLSIENQNRWKELIDTFPITSYYINGHNIMIYYDYSKGEWYYFIKYHGVNP